jgi:hypothetical protein
MDVVTWTPDRVERLTQLFEEGLPTAEIGRRLGLTKNAVIGKLHRIALAPRVTTPVAPPQRSMRHPVVCPLVRCFPVRTPGTGNVTARPNRYRKLVCLRYSVTKCTVIVMAAIRQYLASFFLQKFFCRTDSGQEAPITSDRQSDIVGANLS